MDFLQRSSPIPVADQITSTQLADELRTSIERIQPLIERGYVRVIHLSEDPSTTIIARPLPAGMDWLRTMFMPLQKRPYIPTTDAAAILGMSDRDLRFICVAENIQVYEDPIFGELLSASGFITLKKGLVAREDALRFDKQTIMLILARLKRVKPKSNSKPGDFRYNERIEKEIARIALLPEPQRTFRATDLWAAFNQADVVTNSLKQDGCGKNYTIGTLRKKMGLLEGKITGDLPWNHFKLMRLKVRRRKRRERLERLNAAENHGESASGALPSDHLPANMSSGSESEP